MSMNDATMAKSRHTRADWFANSRMKLRHLTVLLAIERTRSFGRAAAELHTSQPAISKALREIEAAAGLPLFERRPEGACPTAAGTSLLHYAREVFGTLERAGSDLESIAGERAGSLTLGCNFSSAGQVVPDALLLLKRANPLLSVRLEEGTLEMLMPHLRSRKLDIVVARWPRGHDVADLEEHLLFEQAMCVICDPNHPLTREKTVTWKALAAWPWIFPPEGSPVREDLEEMFRRQRVRPKEAGIDCASIFANSILIRELRAIAICPYANAKHFVSEKLVAILPVKLPSVFGPNSVITFREREMTRAMRDFIECLKKITRKKTSRRN